MYNIIIYSLDIIIGTNLTLIIVMYINKYTGSYQNITLY